MNIQEIDKLKIAIHNHKQNNFQVAFSLYSELLSSYPTNNNINYLLGILLIQNGHHESGRNHINVSKISSEELSPNLNPFDDSPKAKINQEINSINLSDNYPIRDFETVDAWRHLRMLDFVTCISNLEDEWLTIGDAYGHDAKILKHKGIKTVTASNLDSRFLQKGHAIGQVDDFIQLNAEQINLPNDSFDFVLCKEALHHMPRPYLAIYEMLRVCKKGVFFIEPQDSYIDWPANKTNFYRQTVKDDLVGEKISFRKYENDEEITKSAIDWWEDGAFNYVYTFSKREIRKISLGLGIPSYAFKTFNDYYDQEISSELTNENGPGFIKTQQQIALQDQLCSIIGKSSSYITGLLFKRTPNDDERLKLIQMNYEFTFTPTRYLPIKWPTIEV